jgi:hypothetical protein
MPWTGQVLLLLLAGGPELTSSGCLDHGRERYAPRSFMGYACEADCERHKAGFGWADRQRLADPVSCEPLDRFEAEGCRAYLEERLSPGQAGYRWALENEIADACLCDGAGERFRLGCRRAVVGRAGQGD